MCPNKAFLCVTLIMLIFQESTIAYYTRVDPHESYLDVISTILKRVGSENVGSRPRNNVLKLGSPSSNKTSGYCLMPAMSETRERDMKRRVHPTPTSDKKLLDILFSTDFMKLNNDLEADFK